MAQRTKTRKPASSDPKDDKPDDDGDGGGKPDDTDDDDDDDDGGQDDQDHGRRSADRGDLDDRIRQIVKEVVKPLLNPSSPSRRSDNEDDLTARVRAAQDKLKAEEERDQRLSRVEETVKKVAERPPARAGLGGRVQRWFWGDDDGER